MSTRATIHFHFPGERAAEAIVYRHHDGYPDGLGKDLKAFVQAVKDQTDDTRFDDPAYLAAKWIVYDALHHSNAMFEDPPKPLKFLSVGIVRTDPDDIAYRYHVVCDGTPKITHEHV